MSAIDYDEESRKRLNWLDITGGGAKDSLTVLDYFAGKAMEGLMQVYWAAPEQYETAGDLLKCHAETAYDYAEAMLAERNKRFTPQNVVKGVTGKTYA